MFETINSSNSVAKLRTLDEEFKSSRYYLMYTWLDWFYIW